MLTEIAIADAYGAGFEFCAIEKISIHNNLEFYCKHELYDISGKYTDDTQMSIAIAEFILSGTEWNKENIAAKFLQCFKRDIRFGYSEGFYNLLTQVSSGKELLNTLISTSERNGAAMRSVPIGFLKNKIDVVTFATLQAQITHNTRLGISSSCAVALAAYYGLQERGTLSELESLKDALDAERILLSPEKLEKREKGILDKHAEVLALQQKYFGPTGELFVKRNQLVQPIQDKVFGAVQEVARKRKLELVLDKSAQSGVLFVEKEKDYSDEVLNSIKQ